MADTDADTSTDADVAAALGIDNAAEEQDQDGADQESEEQEVAFEDLPQKTQDEIRKLRRENAALRVKSRQAAKKTTTESDEKVSTDVEAAREAGREEARAEHGIELTEARVRAALTGVIPDDRLDEFVEDLNISRYVGDDHKPDLDAIAALKDRQASLLGGSRKTRSSNGRASGGKTQKSNAEQFGDALRTAGLLN